MTNEELCALALAAIDSADARVVLADAIEESGWWDERLGEWRWGMPSGGLVRFRRCHLLPPAVNSIATAIAAVLLFGDWPTSWPLAERCWETRRQHDYRVLLEEGVIGPGGVVRPADDQWPPRRR